MIIQDRENHQDFSAEGLPQFIEVRLEKLLQDNAYREVRDLLDFTQEECLSNQPLRLVVDHLLAGKPFNKACRQVLIALKARDQLPSPEQVIDACSSYFPALRTLAVYTAQVHAEKMIPALLKGLVAATDAPSEEYGTTWTMLNFLHQTAEIMQEGFSGPLMLLLKSCRSEPLQRWEVGLRFYTGMDRKCFCCLELLKDAPLKEDQLEVIWDSLVKLSLNETRRATGLQLLAASTKQVVAAHALAEKVHSGEIYTKRRFREFMEKWDIRPSGVASKQIKSLRVLLKEE